MLFIYQEKELIKEQIKPEKITEEQEARKPEKSPERKEEKNRYREERSPSNKKHERKKEYRSKEQRERRSERRSADREKKRDRESDKKRRKYKDELESEIISLEDNSDDMIDLTGDQSDSKGKTYFIRYTNTLQVSTSLISHLTMSEMAHCHFSLLIR